MADRALKVGFESVPAEPEKLLHTTTPAFVTDAAGHVLLWNRAIEKLLDRPRNEALGRHCHDLLAGRDGFGNRFCHESCAVRCMTRKGERVSAFEISVRKRSAGSELVRVSILEVDGPEPGERHLVHLLTPADGMARDPRSPSRASDDETAEGASPLLTRRENEVLQCVAAGLQNKEVAQQLGISVATARNHVHNILEKLDVHSKLEAVSLAFRRGWVRRSS